MATNNVTDRPKEKSRFNLREGLDKLARRTQKMQHNAAQFAAQATPGLPPSTLQAVTFDAYLQPYVLEVRRLVDAGRCCLLTGALGIGKTFVLQQVKAELEANGHTRCVLINIGENNTQLTSVEMLRRVMAQILDKADAGGLVVDQPYAPIYDEEGALRNQLYGWMLTQRSDVVLMLDQVELLDRDQDVMTTIRALYEQQDAYAEQHGSSVRFIAVLTSTQLLRDRIAGVNSPLHNVLDEVRMRDCPADVREAYWETLLAVLPTHSRAALIKQAGFLCGGDPYQMAHVGQRIRQELHDGLQAFPLDASNPVANEANAINLSRRLTYVLSGIRDNPESVAPFLHRYAEMMEEDREALELMVRVEGDEAVLVREAPGKEDGRTASLWGGVFAQEKGVWKWRSDLTRLYFVREFIRRPERMARSLRRKQLFEEAVCYLANYRRQSDATLRSLQDVTANWINSADSPSQAWQVMAHVLDIWFDGAAQVLRFYPRKQNPYNQPGAYYCVRYKQLETPVSAAVHAAAHQAFVERLHEAAPNEIAHRQFTYTHGANEPQVVFPLIREGRAYGALVLSQTALSAENADVETVDRKRDHSERWSRLLNHAFLAIANFENESLRNLDLSRVQRIAQENRELEQTPQVIQLMLTTLTAGWGLKFNRCVLLQAEGKHGLRGKAAIGHHTQAEAHRDWKTGDVPKTFEDAARIMLPGYETQLSTSSVPTPMHHEVTQCFVSDWQADPLLCEVLQQDEPKQVTQAALAQSALKTLMRLDPESGQDGANNPVFLVPLRDGDNGGSGADFNVNAPVLLGVLVLDKPFTRETVSQDQFDLLPNFANQLTLILRREEQQEVNKVFTRLNLVTPKRFSLQQTLDEISKALLDGLSDIISLLVVTLWEETDNSEPKLYPNRRRSTLRIANSAERGPLLNEWKLSYYADEVMCRGPVDQALIEPITYDPHDGSDYRELYIPDLLAWREKHGNQVGAELDEDICTVYSMALGEPSVPRGVISFQSKWPDAYSEDDLRFFKRLANRIANILEKARVFEGLSRARHNTDQLNVALKELMNPKTKKALYDCIVQQMSDFFAEDAQTLGMKRKPDSAALFAVEKGDVFERLAGGDGEMAERLAKQCPKMLTSALDGTQVFIEHAGGELVARELFGETECSAHSYAGAQASVWARIGEANETDNDLLLVMAWANPRRMNHTERASLPVLAEIAARTNGVIEQERKAMKEQLANSLKIEDYELIEAEYAHQWNKRIRTIRNNAKWALEELQLAGEAALPKVQERLSVIAERGAEALERLKFNSKVKESEELALKPWLASVVKRWNMLNSEGGESLIHCAFETTLSDGDMIRTRPIILNWILNELMTNAKEAEQRAQKNGERIRVMAGYNVASREYEISISNPTPMPRPTLQAVRSRTPLDRPNASSRGSGRGIWIASGQVQALLGGELRVPELSDTQTTFTLALRKQIAEV